ncbi:MAG: type VI secretion system ATPase TssH, partial [Firmicutes bacterium]|nr:type VI secretion system ATPase TssH [Bacillota bacterium]
MNIDKYTQNAQQAIIDAQNEAIENGNPTLEPEHLHLALLRQDEGLIPRLLQYMNIDAREVTREVARRVDAFPKVSGGGSGTYAGQAFASLLSKAEKKAQEFKDDYVSVEHLYLAMLANPTRNDREVFSRFGITEASFLEALSKVRGNQRVTSQNPEENYEALNKYGRDLVEMARQGKLDPVIGRDSEIRHTIQILSRRTKNNPVLIGEPGVGQTAVV